MKLDKGRVPEYIEKNERVKYTVYEKGNNTYIRLKKGEFPKLLPEKLFHLRVIRNLSLSQLQKETGIWSVGAVEKGKKGVTRKDLALLAGALSCSIDYLNNDSVPVSVSGLSLSLDLHYKEKIEFPYTFDTEVLKKKGSIDEKIDRYQRVYATCTSASKTVLLDLEDPIQFLEYQRLARRMNFSAFEQFTGVSADVLKSIKYRRRKIGPQTAAKLAEVFGKEEAFFRND